MTFTTSEGQTLVDAIEELSYAATPDGVLIEWGDGGSLWLNYEELDDAYAYVQREQYYQMCDLRLEVNQSLAAKVLASRPGATTSPQIAKEKE